jgi:hypothetical protein
MIFYITCVMHILASYFVNSHETTVISVAAYLIVLLFLNQYQ